MRLNGRIIDEAQSILYAHLYSMFSFPGPVLGSLEWACPEHLGLSSVDCGLVLGIFTRPCTNAVSFPRRIAGVAPPIKPQPCDLSVPHIWAPREMAGQTVVDDT